jgi:hypothetical protein
METAIYTLPIYILKVLDECSQAIGIFGGDLTKVFD